MPAMGKAAPASGETLAGSAGNPARSAAPTAAPTTANSSNATTSGTPGLPTEQMAAETEGAIDPVGVWWTEVETTGSEVLPILDELTGAKIRFVMRVEVSGTAPNHNVKFEFCQLQTYWSDPMDANNTTIIGFRPDTVAAFSESIMVDLGGLKPGSKVPLPGLTFRGGVDESGKNFDEDGDGNPAVTAWVQTVIGIEIEVFETIAISANLDVNAPDADTLLGTVDFRADAEIISSNNPIIIAGTKVTITPDSKTVPVTVKRLAAASGGDCSSVPSTVQFAAVPPPPPPLLPPAEDPAP